MAQVCFWLPAETATQPNVTPAVAATGTGMVTVLDVLPSAMPSWPLMLFPARAHDGKLGGEQHLPSQYNFYARSPPIKL